MRLVRLIYTSSLKTDTDHAEVNKIHAVSQENNTKNNITGMLFFGGRKFLHTIEGGRENVNLLYNKICHDPRHEHVLLLSYGEIAEREFDKFSMKLILLTKSSNKITLRYSIGETFNPYEMSGDTALRMMLAMRDSNTNA
jgi:hypothetical protein